MARNYAALFHEYLEEMADLTDAEFGRLARALLVYSRTGEFPALNGNERLFKRRVIMQEDRAQESYNQVVGKNRANGKLGGRPRKTSGNKENPEKPRETQNNPTKPNETPKTQIKIESEIKTEIDTPLPYGNKGSKAATPPTRETRFTPPTLAEVQAYLAECGSNIDAERFIDFYASKGWMVGKNRMKDWQAAVRTWEKRRKEENDGHSGRDTAHSQNWNIPGEIIL